MVSGGSQTCEMCGDLFAKTTGAQVPVDGDTARDHERLDPIRAAFYDAQVLVGPHRDKVLAWLRDYAGRVRGEGQSPDARRERMQQVNPRYVLRNYLAQEAIDAAATGDPSLIARLLRVLSRPYDDQPGEDDLAQRRPEWARNRAGCSMLSCSS